MDDTEILDTEPTVPGRGWAALAGIVAAALALGVGELLGALSRDIPSPVLAVGNFFVDVTPLTIVRWTVETFGTNDKPVLLSGIVVTTLLIGALLGVLSVKRRWIGIAGFAVFGLFGVWAGMRDPDMSTVGAVVVPLIAGAAGIGALLLLLRLLERTPQHEEGASDRDRRAFIIAALSVGAFGVVSAMAGRWLGARSIVEAARSSLQLPTGSVPVESSTAAISAAKIPGLSPLYTPNRDFYRVDTELQTPQIDPATWSLGFNGMVDNPYELSFAELIDMPMVEETITLCCVSNQVGGNLVGNARWLGVPLHDLLDEAGVQPDATQVVGRSVGGFTVGFPTDVLEGGRPALVAVGMNGEPLPANHGFPARLVVSGLYGYVSATKWLTEVELTRLEDYDAYWIPRGWAKEAPVKTQSRIDTPRDRAGVPTGTIPVAGVAWAQSRDISRVEVQVDEGPWRDAALGDRVSAHAWRQWVYGWEAEPGPHRIRVRATDGTGATQTDVVGGPRPDGATGYHAISVNVGTV
jgi:DMSO/TMAO reductase YedYZ molybdopterin-dependent catalytic subunit